MGIPVAFNQITALTAARPLGHGLSTWGANAYPPTAQWAVIVAEGQAVRWRDDGTDPTATVGMILPVNTPMVYEGSLSKIRFIESAATAKLNISFYKSGGFTILPEGVEPLRTRKASRKRKKAAKPKKGAKK